MFDTGKLDCATLGWWRAELRQLDRRVTDAERIDQLRALEDLKAAAAAAQARIAVDLDASQRAEQDEAGVPAGDLGRGIAAQVALARRESPHHGGRHLGLAKALVHEMPNALAAMEAGRLSEWRATLLVRETACLERADRQRIDGDLCSDVERLESYGDRRLVAEVKKLAYRLDPHSVVDRTSKAVADRRVTVRPAPDTMCYLTGLLPVAQGVAVFAALSSHADSCRAAGDPRSRGQIMADTLVERVTGQATAAAVPITANLVMTDLTLFAGSNEPAHLIGYGPVPGAVARNLVNSAADAWVRRLYV
ncbi:MAG: 13E12 repeat family protein, partial [Actinomycetota bacterium]|nr:13E12 repeat family protein [Actinomycetota bacterium]